MKGWYGDRHKHMLASKGIRSNGIVQPSSVGNVSTINDDMLIDSTYKLQNTVWELHSLRIGNIEPTDIGFPEDFTTIEAIEYINHNLQNDIMEHANILRRNGIYTEEDAIYNFNSVGYNGRTGETWWN